MPMALYKHVANKEELLDGMVEVIVGEIDPRSRRRTGRARSGSGSSRPGRALLRHPWAPRVIESRTNTTPAVLGYMDSIIGMFLAGGLLGGPHPPRRCMPWAAACWGSPRSCSTTPAGGDPDGAGRHVREMAGMYPTSQSPWPSPTTTVCRRSRLRRPVRVRVRPRPAPGRLRAAPPTELVIGAGEAGAGIAALSARRR